MLAPGFKPNKFYLTEKFKTKLKKTQVDWKFGGLSAFTYYRTYARKKDNGGLETWAECVIRVTEGSFTILKTHATSTFIPWDEEKGQVLAEEFALGIFNFKWTPPGRGLWMMGTDFIYEKGAAALNNCAFISTEHIHSEYSRPFAFLMDMSMLGVGVGFDTKGADSLVLLEPLGISELVIVEDSREGWVEAIACLIDSYMEPASRPIEIDVSLVRAYGEPIKGFGGVASGPEPLVQGFNGIRDILSKRANSDDNRIKSTDIVDIMNLIGKIVVAGNVRRCLPEDTLIHTENGLIKIQNIVSGTKAYTSSGLSTISELVKQGKQQVLNIHTQLGIFNCTEKHKIAKLISPTQYEWIQAKDLQQGDRLVFPEHRVKGGYTKFPEWYYEKSIHSTTCKDITIPELNSDTAWLLGLFHGDGYVYPNFENNGYNAYISIACDNINYPEITTKAKNILKSFGENLNFCDVKEKETDLSYKIRIQSKQLAWYFSKFKKSHTEIEIPDFILQGTEDVRAAYLAGLFDSDGSCKTRPINLVTTVYYKFAKQVQSLYASLGIPVKLKIKERKEKNWKTLNLVNLVSTDSIIKFEKIVSIFCNKYNNTNKTLRSQNSYGYPSNWIDKKLINYGSKWTPQSKQMIYSKYKELGGESNLIPIEVEKIEIGDIFETYDISIPEAKEFIVGEGLLVHNTAELALASVDDVDFTEMKDYNKFPVEIGIKAPDELKIVSQKDYDLYNNDFNSRSIIAKKYINEEWAYKFGGWRWASNNSLFAEIGMDYSKIAKNIAINGEPGLIWLDTMRAYSRLKEIPDYKDKKAQGTNPCSEQTLESYELCCLCENYPANHKDYYEFQRTLKFAYLYAKIVTLVATHWPETNSVITRNRRIGCSQSGILEAMVKFGRRNYLDNFCDKAYNYIQYVDKKYSEWMGIPRSIKTTSVKPSGSVSLVSGALPGIHGAESTAYYRTVRLSTISDLIPLLKNANYRIEPAASDPIRTSVVYFPVLLADNVPCIKDLSIWEQFQNAADMQKYWADNQVSITVTFKQNEINQISRVLECYDNQLKSVSLLPLSEHGYEQAPYIEAPREEVKKYMETLLPIDFSILTKEGDNAEANKFCDSTGCEI